MKCGNLIIVADGDIDDKDIINLACDEVLDTDDDLIHNDALDWRNIILNLSFRCYSVNDEDYLLAEKSNLVISRYFSRASRDKILEITSFLITKIQPLLINKKNAVIDKQSKGLNPKLGFSFGDDEVYEIWKKNGGIRSIPLCLTILSHLPIDKISTNLWWISPFILNLLDATSDLQNLRLPGVKLLHVMLEKVFIDQYSNKWLKFKDTGLFQEYERILINFCFYLPPSYDSQNTLLIWRQVFPAIYSLYKAQYIEDEYQLRLHILKFISEVILQNCLPRCGCKYDQLTSFLIHFMIEMIRTLGEKSTIYIQRVIYDIGQYLIKDPFFTAFDKLIFETIELVEAIIGYCNTTRVLEHRYDILGIILLIYGKLKNEESMSDKIRKQLQHTIKMLKDRGCNFSYEIKHLKSVKGIDYTELFAV